MALSVDFICVGRSVILTALRVDGTISSCLAYFLVPKLLAPPSLKLLIVDTLLSAEVLDIGTRCTKLIEGLDFTESYF